jgi:hypothetical protein
MMMEGGKHKVRRNGLCELVYLEPRSARAMRGRLWVVEKDGPEDHLSEDCKHEDGPSCFDQLPDRLDRKVKPGS